LKVLNTSAAFLLSVSSVQPEWLTEMELAVVTALSEDMLSRESVEPVGPRILIQTIIGPRAMRLHQLEADIRSNLSADSLLELDVSVAAGQLSWWTTRGNHAAVRQQVESVIDKARGLLAKGTVSRD
jgi:hypothetical protein